MSIVQTYKFNGWCTEGYDASNPYKPGQVVPDLLLMPGPPPGKLYFLESCVLGIDLPVSKSWAQANFVYTKVLNGAVREAWSPNCQSLCTHKIPASTTGTFSAGGGATETGPTETWYEWTQPLPMTSSQQCQLGGDIGVGNSNSITLTYTDGGSANEIRFSSWNGPDSDVVLGSDFPVCPEGKQWLVETAFVKADGPWAGGMYSEATGAALTGIHTADLGATQTTGGYSTHQSSESLGGSWLIYPFNVYLQAGDRPLIKATAPNPQTFGYLALIAEVDAPT
jgi:hypothetical protein